MDIGAQETFGTWSVPQCPLTIEYSRRVLDDIRLAVVDAFFSLPRGGAEIGGILLGSVEKGRVTVTDYQALDCEHALGPSFNLSENDFHRLAALIDKARGTRRRVVGWYHSHTRSEIFLSDADIEIHKRFFPEMWQVALVIKPHTFQPTRAGWFFQEKPGVIHAEESYEEFVLEPLAVSPIPKAPLPTASAPEPIDGPVINVARPSPGESRDFEPEVAEPEPPPRPIPPPAFTAAEPPPSRRWIVPLGIVVGIAIAFAGFQTRGMWLRPAPTASGPAPAPAPSTPIVSGAGLNAVEQDGQLQIRWNPNAPTIRSAASAVITVQDGDKPVAFTLDPAHLQAGVVTYRRESQRADVTLTVNAPGAAPYSEATTYSGKVPVAPAETDAPSGDTGDLKAELARQVQRTSRLERRVGDLERELQRRRLGKQDVGK